MSDSVPAPETIISNPNDPQAVAARIAEKYPDAIESSTPQGLVVKSERLVDVARFLRDAPDVKFNYLNNVTSVDWPDRFEVVYHLTPIERGGAPLTLRVNANKQDPVVPSLVPVFRGANFQEREVYDLMGIRFAGHPDLRRILLWEGFEGYPLRKDYKEPYFEEEKKPFSSRWDKGRHVIAEDRNPWHDNVKYPAGFDALTYKPLPETIRAVNPTDALVTKLQTDRIVVNFGPQHPSTHGVLRLKAVVEGETVAMVDPVLGYLHRNHEKIGERNTWLMNMPYTDRLDYFTGMGNNFGYAVAVEKMLGIVPPERAEYLRVIMAELTRIVNHFVSMGFFYNELGAFFTPMLYALEEREYIVDLFEEAAGSRMMVNYFRFGGLCRDVPEGWLDKVRRLVDERIPRAIDEFEEYLVGNEIFQNRSRNIGVLPYDDAINFSAAGPVLRASGVKYDVRRAEPYSIYNRFEFDIPTGTRGDVYDRFIVRLEEMRQSVRILKQALKQIPEGEIQTGKKNYQFRVPKGDHYGRVENPKGELGYYVASDGGPNPYRYHVRSPSFINLGATNFMTVRQKIADLVIIVGSVDVVMGEVDR
jgi:NADH/F420H2 dehydrogenase subunit C